MSVWTHRLGKGSVEHKAVHLVGLFIWHQLERVAVCGIKVNAFPPRASLDVVCKCCSGHVVALANCLCGL